MQKPALCKQITESLKARLRVLHDAARAAQTEATDETSKADNKYDTRSLEAGYLAQGQARQIRALVDDINLYEALKPRDFAADEPIDLMALVHLDVDGNPTTYFIGPRSGGVEVTCDGETIIVITPNSPLGQTLMGKTTGQHWTTKRGGTTINYRILSVQ